MNYFSFRNAILALSIGISHHSWAADTSLNNLFDLGQDCKIEHNSVTSFDQMLSCGSVHGAMRTAYYSLGNGYFVNGLDQDTVTMGGFIKYETAPFYGIQAAIGFDLQRRLDEKDHKAEVSELKEDGDGLAEAYLTWKNDSVRVTVGNQRLNLPFLGDYADWRVLMFLYQAADIQIGNHTDFIRLTKVNKYKSYAEDQFSETSRQSAMTETDGMWSVGVAKTLGLDADQTLKGQFWYQNYADYSNLIYAQLNLNFVKQPYSPDIALQYLSGEEQGKAYAGKVDSQITGIQLALKPTATSNFKVAYNYIKPDADSYLNGALLTPYSRNTSSGPLFAQPFFTSTQDLGAGNAFMTSFEGKLNPQTILGARYSFMDLKDKAELPSRNQSEYLVYGIYNFSGKLKGLSVSNFAGVQTSPRYDKNFFQNRFTLSYKF